jgi:uncharacterized protein (TIGR03118 family)
MFSWLRNCRFFSKQRPVRKPWRRNLLVEYLEDRCMPAGFLQTNLVSNLAGVAQFTDPNLVNPWGLSYAPGGVFWVSDNNAGVSTLYNGQGQAQSLVVDIPSPGHPTGATGTPTGTVFNGGSGFVISAGGNSGPAIFLFATEDGTIAGWNPGVSTTQAVIAVDNSANPTAATGAVYKGLAIGTDSTNRTLLYAANFRAGTIDVFDQNFHATTVPGGFTDTKIPAGFAPFDIQNLNGNLYVTYAKQDAAKHDDVAGLGNGFVDVFNTNGVLLNRLVAGGQLDSPWGVAIAPANFGSFSNDLLVGNFGNGHINAYAPTNGAFVGTLTDGAGTPIAINGLWALKFGNGGQAGPTNTLYFSAGLNHENDGLFGSLQALPNVSTASPIVPNLFSFPQPSVSTVPASGDVNPYGVAFVPQSFAGNGVLQPGDVLVSNFNNSTNTQGTGTSIVRIDAAGNQSVFFQGQPGLGLTTALGVLQSGFVIVGNVPNNNGAIGQGSLLVLDANGNVVEQLANSQLLDGPWDLTINDQGSTAQVYVSNVLSGTVTRINLKIPAGGIPFISSETQIASGFTHRPDPNALLVGPTGLAYDAVHDILYVASTGDNAIFAIPNASKDQNDSSPVLTVYKDPAHLHGPLGLVLAPNGDLITSNGDAVNANANQVNELVEFTTTGHFVAQTPVDTSGTPGGAFGIALATFGGEVRFAAVDDNQNSVLLQALPNLPTTAAIVPNLFQNTATPQQTFSTVPSNGDVNPYGVAYVPQGYTGGGLLQAGDLLVSNFNNSTNTQGTGTTIVLITPSGQRSVFFQGPAGLGLTTALGVLQSGFVLVGSVPNNNGTIGSGALLVLNANGQIVEQIADANVLDGPWDLTINDQGSLAQVFVSNVLSGTVTRINLKIPQGGLPTVQSMTQIATGFIHRPDPNALLVGPTGLAFDAKHDILYVASTGDNAIYAIPNALTAQTDFGTGAIIYQDPAHLHGPLGLVLAPNGDLIASNGDAVNANANQTNELVEFTPTGHFVAQTPVDFSGTPGGAFGIAIATFGNDIRFAAADDNLNAVNVWTFDPETVAPKKQVAIKQVAIGRRGSLG